MRAREFIIEGKEKYEGITIEMSEQQGPYNMQLVINALTDDGKLLGFVIFNIGDSRELDPQELEVSEKYRGQGVAKVMYDYVKSKGYKIVRSPDQTPDGKYFWDKNRGEEVNVWEGRENYNGINMLLQSDEDEVFVKASAGSRELGHVLFVIDGEYLLPQDLEVEPQYRGYNIARKMYDFVKSKGYKIRRSGNQTADGSRFWDKNRPEQNVWENVPQPGQSSGSPTQFAPGTKIQNRQMTASQIISSIPGVPYYNNVVDDWDSKDYSWGVTQKVIEYAKYLKQHPESLANLPPIQVVNGQFKDGAHRVSAIWLLQQRMDPKNPLWKNAKLNVQFANKKVLESSNELVPANQIYASVQKIHRALDDFSEGDLGDRIYWFDDYKLVNLPISKLNLDEHWVDEDYVEDYMNHIADSKHTMPPIVFDPIAGSIIDGTHRANAYARLGNKTIPAYVGNTKSQYYGQRDSD